MPAATETMPQPWRPPVGADQRAGAPERPSQHRTTADGGRRDGLSREPYPPQQPPGRATPTEPRVWGGGRLCPHGHHRVGSGARTDGGGKPAAHCYTRCRSAAAPRRRDWRAGDGAAAATPQQRRPSADRTHRPPAAAGEHPSMRCGRAAADARRPPPPGGSSAAPPTLGGEAAAATAAVLGRHHRLCIICAGGGGSPQRPARPPCGRRGRRRPTPRRARRQRPLAARDAGGGRSGHPVAAESALPSSPAACAGGVNVAGRVARRPVLPYRRPGGRPWRFRDATTSIESRLGLRLTVDRSFDSIIAFQRSLTERHLGQRLVLTQRIVKPNQA